MKKIRIASIMLGVLILVGMMSGVALAQVVEEPVQEETITIPDYENFPFKHHDFYKDDVVQYDQYYYIREFESTDKRITMDTLMKDIIEGPSGYQGEQIALVTLKDVIIITETTIGESFSDTTLIWIPETSISVLEITSDYIVVKSVDWEDWKSTARFATKENGQWKFVDYETLQAKGEELKRKYREKQQEKQN